jgi:hypothetical protein
MLRQVLSLTDTELRAESPTINCSGQTGITLSFNYIEFGDGTEDNAQVWYFDGVTWSMLADMPKTIMWRQCWRSL